MLCQVDALDRTKAIVAQAVSDHVTNHDYLRELIT